MVQYLNNLFKFDIIVCNKKKIVFNVVHSPLQWMGQFLDYYSILSECLLELFEKKLDNECLI